MKNQALFSSKDKRKKLKCRLLQFLFGVLRVIPEKYLWDWVVGTPIFGSQGEKSFVLSLK